MKTLLVLLIFFINVPFSFGKIETSLIIPKFYELLLNKEKPSEQDENDFFGGDECSHIRAVLTAEGIAQKSKTPVWDFVRKNKSLFITVNILNFNDARITYSAPFGMSRMWNKTDKNEKYVCAKFPEKVLENEVKTSQGVSIIIFTLGEKCYLDIGKTVKTGSSSTFLDYLYGTKKSP